MDTPPPPDSAAPAERRKRASRALPTPDPGNAAAPIPWPRLLSWRAASASFNSTPVAAARHPLRAALAAAMLLLAAVVAAAQQPKAFRDCPTCPEMVPLAAGSFLMGSPPEEPGRGTDEAPRRRVQVGAFAIGRFEVTQGQWKAVMGETPSLFDDCGTNCPVEGVSWNDVQVFISLLNRMTGQRYRLPTEAEWEYACRAGQAFRYCGGNDPLAVGWVAQNSGERTRPVGQFQPNAFGLHDMTGNVWEWVQDCYHGQAHSGVALSDGRAHEATGCTWRVIRGCSVYFPADEARAAFCARWPAAAHTETLGFRLARDLDVDAGPGRR